MADELYRVIESSQAVARPGVPAVVDLTACRFIDSSAMGVLVRSATAGPRLSVRGAAGQVRRALDLAGIGSHPGIDLLES